jgi:hypothetical protein
MVITRPPARQYDAKQKRVDLAKHFSNGMMPGLANCNL